MGLLSSLFRPLTTLGGALKSGGGGSSKTSEPVLNEVDEQLRLQRGLAELAEEQRIAAEGRAGIKREEDLGNFTTRLDQLFGSSLDTGTNQLQRQGLDMEQFLPLLQERLTTQRQRVPELAADPGSYFDIDSIVNDLVGDEQGYARRDLNQQLNQFAAPGFANQRVGNELDDPFLAAILGEQYTDASTKLTRARDRGNLTDFGFNSALGQLDTQKSAANSRLQSLGGGILEDFRTGLTDIAGQGRARADSFQFGDTYDPSTTQFDLDKLFGERSGRLEGDIRGALGGEQLFDIGDILGRASSAQGAQNQTAGSPALLSALASREEDRAKSRGIGSQGVF